MKKYLLLITLFFVMLSTSSCGIYDGDSATARDNTLTLVDYIENNKVEEIKDLYSLVVQKEVKDLDDQIRSLCEFYSGEYQSITNLGLGSTINYDYGSEVREFTMFYIIESSTNSYYFSILWKIKDDYEEDNIGIWSMIVEEKNGDDPMTPLDDWINGITIR